MNGITSTLNLLLRVKEANIQKMKRASRRNILRRQRLEGEVK